MARQERFVNKAVTDLSAEIANSGVTSISVTDGSVFPSEGDFQIMVRSEIMTVTARSGNTLTVIRGRDATTASLHPQGAAVYSVLTKGALEARLDQTLSQPWGMSGVPDGYPFRLLDENDNDLTSSSFTWFNQGSSTVTDHASGSFTVQLDTPGADPEIRGLEKSMPTAPFNLTACLVANSGGLYDGSGQNYFGIGLRENATGKMVTWTLAPSYAFLLWSHTGNNENTQRTLFTSDFGVRMWLRFNYASGVVTPYSSMNGYHWRSYSSWDSTSFWTTAPDRLIVAGNNQGTITEQVSLVAWYEH